MSQENVETVSGRGTEAFDRGDIERWLEGLPTRRRSSSLRSRDWRANTQDSMT